MIQTEYTQNMRAVNPIGSPPIDLIFPFSNWLTF